MVLDGTPIGGVTDVNGFYTLDNVPPQTYTTTASYVGYRTSTRYNVVVRSGGNPNVNFALQESLDSLSEVVIQTSPFGKNIETPNSIQRLSQEESPPIPVVTTTLTG